MYWNWCIWCDGKCALSKQCVVNLKSRSQTSTKIGDTFPKQCKNGSLCVLSTDFLFLIASVYFLECCLLLIAK